jgi:hypothetical protein
MSEHHHSEFEEILAAYPEHAGRPVDQELLGQFIGAAFDRCSCQEMLLARMVEDPATTARLIELTCLTTQVAFGGLPAYLIEDGVPGPASSEFRQLGRASLDGTHTTRFIVCEQMASSQRRDAAHTATDILIGNLHLQVAHDHDRDLTGGGGFPASW